MVCMKLQTEGENKKRGEIQTGGGEREGDDVGGGGGYGRRTEGVVNKKGNGGGENDRGKGRGRGRKRDGEEEFFREISGGKWGRKGRLENVRDVRS